ncbi:PLK2, partial [Cordylochernes scorpioides]
MLLQMLREIELHRSLQHPNIVHFHHFFSDAHNIYIILENCSRKSLVHVLCGLEYMCCVMQSLVHVLKHRKSLTEPEVRYYLRQLCAGVAYIHDRHVIHRDLKLGNMLLTESMRLKIADFGLATRLSPAASTPASKKPTVCGTPNYIAPEVLSRKAHGIEMDIWAIGCIMYAMLVGLPPFESSSLSETFSRISRNCYYIPGQVSDPARDLIRRILQGCPADRPTISEILSHGFFSSGPCPEVLPPSACHSAPHYLTPPPH